MADPDRIEQVVENLFANALRHTPDGGTVELRADSEGDAIVLTVIDSGRGIAAEHVPFVFDRFYKVDAARRQRSRRERSRPVDCEGDRRAAPRIDRRDQRARPHGLHHRAAAPSQLRRIAQSTSTNL